MEATTAAVVLTVEEIMERNAREFSDWKAGPWAILRQGRKGLPRNMDIVRERNIQKWRLIQVSEDGIPEQYRCRFSQNKFAIPIYGKLKNGFIGLGGVVFARPTEYLLVAVGEDGNDVELGRIGHRDVAYKVDHVGEDKLKRLYNQDVDSGNYSLRGQELLAIEVVEDSWIKGKIIETPIRNGRFLAGKVFLPRGSRLLFSVDGFLVGIENEEDFFKKYVSLFDQ